MLKYISATGVLIFVVLITAATFLVLDNKCSLDSPLIEFDRYLKPNRFDNSNQAKPAQNVNEKATATFNLRIAGPNRIEGRYYKENGGDGEQSGWRQKFFCDTKIGEFLLALFTLFLALYTARLYWATDKLTDADRPHVLVGHYSLTGLRNTDSAVTTVNVDYAFKNHGKSPAFCEMLTVDLMHVNNGELPKQPTYKHRRPNFLILGPGISIAPSKGSRAGIPFTLEERQKVIAGTATLYVSGRIEYRDALKKPHKSSFLYVLRVGSSEAEDFFEAVGPKSYWSYT